MAKLIEDLNALDFSVYLGGPLQAAIQAQQAASLATVNFIQQLGFEAAGNPNDPDKLRYVTFRYKKKIPNPTYDPNDPTSSTYTEEEVETLVPLILLMNLPSFRIDELETEFNAKLTSAETTSLNTEFAANAALEINYRVVNFKASASYKRTTTSNASVEKTYNLRVRARAVNDELPAGLDRILTMLEETIVG